MSGSIFLRPFNALMALCLLLGLWSLGALLVDMEVAFVHMGAHLIDQRGAFIAHVAASALALAIGPLQLLPGLRRERPRLHRWAGRLYAVCGVVGGASGVLLGGSAIGGPVAASGFVLLGVLWVATTLQAARLAMAGRIAAHRRWALRAFTLGCAAVALRLELLILMGAGLAYPAASQIAAWACWAPFLAILEARFALSANARAPRAAAEPQA